MNKTTRSDVKFLYASIGGMFHDRQIPKFQGLPLFFSQTIQGLFQFSEIQGFVDTGLEFKAGTGTLHLTARVQDNLNKPARYRN